MNFQLKLASEQLRISRADPILGAGLQAMLILAIDQHRKYSKMKKKNKEVTSIIIYTI